MRALLEEGKAPEFVLSDKYLPNDERPVMVVVVSMPTLAIKTGIVLWGHYRGYGIWDVGGEPAQVYAWKDWPPELTESELNWIEWSMVDRVINGNVSQPHPPPIPTPPTPQLIEIGDGTRPLPDVWSTNQVLVIMVVTGVMMFAIGLLAG